MSRVVLLALVIAAAIAGLSIACDPPASAQQATPVTAETPRECRFPAPLAAVSCIEGNIHGPRCLVCAHEPLSSAARCRWIDPRECP